MPDAPDHRYQTEVRSGDNRLARGYCPHCDHRVAFIDPPGGSPSWTFREHRGTGDDEADQTVEHCFMIGICPNVECGKPTIVYEVVSWYSRYNEETLLERREVVYPHASGRTIHAPEVPDDLRALFAEAGRIEGLSPNGAAFLARRILERVLRGQLKSKKKLAQLIDLYLERESLPPTLHSLMHDVRGFGNIAGHAGTTAEGELVDVEPREASYVLDVVSELLDLVYVRPVRQQEMRSRWEAKSQGQRLPTTSNSTGIIIEPAREQPAGGSVEPDDDLPF